MELITMKNNIPAELRKASGIYEIRNIKTSQVYVGSAVNLYQRFCNHGNRLRKNKHHNPHLQRSANKHGIENFIFTPICIVNPLPSETFKDRLLERESFYTKELSALDPERGYNIRITPESNFGLTGKKGVPCPNRQGELNALTSLSNAQVLEIVNLVDKGVKRGDILLRFNITRSMLQHIISGNTWAAITGIAPGARIRGRGEQLSYSILKEGQVNDIVEMARNGATFSAIAKQFNICNSHVSQIMCGRLWSHITGIVKHNPKKKLKLTEEDVLSIKSLLEDKVSSNRISQRFNVTKQTVLAIKNGRIWSNVTGYEFKPEKKFKPALTEQQIEVAQQMLSSHISTIRIANDLQVDRNAIVRLRRRLLKNQAK